MRFVTEQTELTTAATDILLVVVALLCVASLVRFFRRDPWRVGLWSGVFSLLAGAALLGAVVHGVELSRGLKDLLWQPLFLFLGFVVALFVVASVYDWKGKSTAIRLLPVMLVVAVVFFVVTRLVPSGFFVFVIYEALAMIFALSVYSLLAFRRQIGGAAIIALSIVLNMVAAAVQANNAISLDVIWVFDHNGIFHLIQIVAIVVMFLGVQSGFASQTEI